MKVKVTYTTEYEDVPDIASRLVERCRNDLRLGSEFKFDFFNLDETRTAITKLQEKLELVSLQLDDCYQLCRGYVEARTENSPEAVEAEELGEASEDE